MISMKKNIRLSDLDHRIIFGLLIITLSFPLIYPSVIPFPLTTYSKTYWDYIVNVIPDESIVVFQNQIDPSIDPQLGSGATLSIVSSIQHTGIAPLYIERPFANLMSLSIKNQNPSGVMTTFVSGAYVGSGSMPLTVAPPTANTLPIQTRGFLE